MIQAHKGLFYYFPGPISFKDFSLVDNSSTPRNIIGLNGLCCCEYKLQRLTKTNKTIQRTVNYSNKACDFM